MVRMSAASILTWYVIPQKAEGKRDRILVKITYLSIKSSRHAEQQARTFL